VPDTDRNRELARLFRQDLWNMKGRQVTTSGMDFFVIRERHIAEGWISWDVLGLLRSLGVPVPGDADWQQTGG
jgi:hypothetical protein